MGMPQQPAVYNAGVGYPVNDSVDGNLALVDVYGTGQYGNLFARSVNAPIIGGLIPSGDQSGVTDTAMINALVSQGVQRIQLGQGSYYISSLTLNAPPQYLNGAGEDVTTIYAVGNADCIRMYNPHNPLTGFTGINAWGGGVQNLTIDGSLNTGASAWGLHIGDGEEYRLVNLTIRNFTGATGGGLNIDNSIWFTEKMWARVRLLNNTTACLMQVSNALADVSFAMHDIGLDIYALPNQVGVSIQNGPLLYNGRLAVKGNFKGSTSGSNTGIALALAGNGGKENTYSSIRNMKLEFQVEVDGGSSGGFPQTINFGQQFTTIQASNGFLRFSGNWASTNLQSYVPGTVATSQAIFKFSGEFDGDSGLSPVGTSGTNPPCLQVDDSLIYSAAPLGSGGGCSSGRADFWTPTSLVLAANQTIPLIDSSTYTGPQRKVFMFVQAASGGPYTVAFAASGGTIYWPGGTAPAMPGAPSAAMVVEFVTTDGVNWFGHLLGSTAAPATSFSPPDPATTVSTTLVMAGFGSSGGGGVSYTPNSSSQVRVTIVSYATQTAATTTVSARRGTGTAPNQGVAVTGTSFGGQPQVKAGADACYTINTILTGMTVGVPNWVDLAYDTSNASDAAGLTDTEITFQELS